MQTVETERARIDEQTDVLVGQFVDGELLLVLHIDVQINQFGLQGLVLLPHLHLVIISPLVLRVVDLGYFLARKLEQMLFSQLIERLRVGLFVQVDFVVVRDVFRELETVELFFSSLIGAVFIKYLALHQSLLVLQSLVVLAVFLHTLRGRSQVQFLLLELVFRRPSLEIFQLQKLIQNEELLSAVLFFQRPELLLAEVLVLQIELLIVLEVLEALDVTDHELVENVLLDLLDFLLFIGVELSLLFPELLFRVVHHVELVSLLGPEVLLFLQFLLPKINYGSDGCEHGFVSVRLVQNYFEDFSVFQSGQILGRIVIVLVGLLHFFLHESLAYFLGLELLSLI